jgi:hypothetical protein
MAIQLQGLRQRVDPHWKRGISYLKIGIRWLKGVLHKGRVLLSVLGKNQLKCQAISSFSECFTFLLQL